MHSYLIDPKGDRIDNIFFMDSDSECSMRKGRSHNEKVKGYAGNCYIYNAQKTERKMGRKTMHTKNLKLWTLMLAVLLVVTMTAGILLPAYGTSEKTP